ncbi:LPS translocon maturation chaperone LptM [Alteromonas sp. H39]|uniref:LPS translocon maturation chaperone LptM n=1 Tax=Alteromonas sp. H39 TaxID=3389876 RepID=UPI0039DF6073
MRVALVLFTLLLSGCGYRGALYLPEEQSQNTTSSQTAVDDTDTSDDIRTPPANDSTGDQN